MSAEPLPVESPPPLTRTESLERVFETERRLLDQLRDVLLHQRTGLSTNDIPTLDDSVFSAQRLFLTLQEARRRRRALLDLVAGDADLPLAELEDHVADLAASVRIARDRLLESARGLHRELEINRKVLDGAIGVGDQLIRAFSGSEPAPTYSAGPDADGSASGSSGSLVNTRA